MRIAVTGATGFLGAHFVRQSLAAGCVVRALVRPESDRSNLSGLELELVEGCLGEGDGLEGFPGAVDLVVHLAALYAEGEASRARLWQVNVEGTRELLAAAQRDEVGRFVHVSTMGTCAPRPDGRPATEADHIDPARARSPYAASKLEAERIVLADRSLEVVVANPAAPVGRFDLRPSVTGERIRDVVAGRWPRLLAGPVNHVPAGACADGLLAVARRGRPGERYLLGGENLAREDFLRRVAAAAGRSPPRPTLLQRLRRQRRPSPGSLVIDDSKAREQLGYESGDLDAAFREAAAWFRERGA